MYNLSEMQIAGNEFREVFRTGLKPFVENFMTASMGKIILDIIAFDVYLKKTHSDYNDSTSMNTIIKKHYGDAGIQLIDKLSP